jgi:hypothetical protein
MVGVALGRRLAVRMRDSETVAVLPPLIEDDADDRDETEADADGALAEGSAVLDPKLGEVTAVCVCTKDLLATPLAETTVADDDADPDTVLLSRADADPQFE